MQIWLCCVCLASPGSSCASTGGICALYLLQELFCVGDELPTLECYVHIR